MTDIRFEDHGSVVLIRPLNEFATEWLSENLMADSPRFGGAVVCEPRYVENIWDALRAEGFACKLVIA